MDSNTPASPRKESSSSKSSNPSSPRDNKSKVADPVRVVPVDSKGNLAAPDSPESAPANGQAKRPSLISPQRKAQKKASQPSVASPRGQNHRRQISFADDHQRPIAEVQEIERRKEGDSTEPSSCCTIS